MFTSNGASSFTPVIQSNLNNTATISGKRIGMLTLDAVNVEQHESALRITDNPIESGAVVADHAALEPKSVTITGIIVDYEPHGRGASSSSDFNLRGGTNFLDSLIPSGFETITAVTKARIQRELSSFVVNSESGSMRSLAPWLPDFSTSNAIDNSTGSNRIQRINEDFEKLQKSGEVIEVQTEMKLYKNMLIELISVTQENESSAELTIRAREVHIVETNTIGGVSVGSGSSGTKSGRAGKQGAEKSQKGKTQPKEEKDRSLLDAIGDNL